MKSQVINLDAERDVNYIILCIVNTVILGTCGARRIPEMSDSSFVKNMNLFLRWMNNAWTQDKVINTVDNHQVPQSKINIMGEIQNHFPECSSLRNSFPCLRVSDPGPGRFGSTVGAPARVPVMVWFWPGVHISVAVGLRSWSVSGWRQLLVASVSCWVHRKLHLRLHDFGTLNSSKQDSLSL